jgi:flagellar motor switch/type III secretory pathway protein FliN
MKDMPGEDKGEEIKDVEADSVEEEALDDLEEKAVEEPDDEVLDEEGEMETEKEEEEEDSAEEEMAQDAVEEKELPVMEEMPTELSPEDNAIEAPTAEPSHVQPAEAAAIPIPEAFLQAEYRKGTSASVAKMLIVITFEVGRKSIRLGDLETLQEGFIFECENLIETSVNICANGQLIGKGNLLNIEGRIGVRVTEIY